MGTLLFLAYINDIPSVVESTAMLLADDTMIYRQVSTPAEDSCLRLILTVWWHGQIDGRYHLMRTNARF